MHIPLGLVFIFLIILIIFAVSGEHVPERACLARLLGSVLSQPLRSGPLDAGWESAAHHRSISEICLEGMKGEGRGGVGWLASLQRLFVLKWSLLKVKLGPYF